MDEVGVESDYAPAGVSIRHGAVLEEEKIDVDRPSTNGHVKRKAPNGTKTVNYNVDGSEEDSEEDAVPLVCQFPAACSHKRCHRALPSNLCLLC